MSRRDKGLERDIALLRIDQLAALSAKALSNGKADRAKRYGELARRINMRYKARSRTMRLAFCRKCNMPLVAGSTLRARTLAGRLVRTCLVCGDVRRTVIGRRSKHAVR
ncbi:MAG: ribonuclease P [Euryarchaeota archaeon]|nr:ribonuclease P [Euryarchaeota archaeon]